MHIHQVNFDIDGICSYNPERKGYRMKQLTPVFRFALHVAGLAIIMMVLFTINNAEAQMNAFKLGTFDVNGEQMLGIVLNDRTVIDVVAANEDYQKKEDVAPKAFPATMKGLIEQHDWTKNRITEILDFLKARGFLSRTDLGYIHDISSTQILAPIMYPNKLICTAVNFREHAREGGRDPESQEKAPPYLFLKPPTTTIIGHRDLVKIPAGHEMIDWEIEFATIIGKPAHNVTAEEAPEYIFGYTIVLDISNRDGRGNTNFGSNWFTAKAYDTFAPSGPFIVPREFIKNERDMRMTLKVNDRVMQDETNSVMIHDQFELVAYISSVCTLEPGDMILSGTPSGVGKGHKPPVFLKSGDVITATIEGIGTLISPVK